MENTLPQLREKLRRNPDDPNSLISIILVAGIPGSGKGRFANTMKRLLMNEYLNTYDFKMPSVQKSTRYDTNEFVGELCAFTDGI